MLKLRIVCVDYYLNPPTRGLDVTYSRFRGTPVKEVPIIRVFGSTSNGVKVCTHVHGVFPYMFIPYDGKSSDVSSAMYQIANDLDKALNNAFEQTTKKQYVFKITLVSGIPFYGYHKKARNFLKIFFYNPGTMKKATSLLEESKICGTHFQPHEAHVPYILQFFMDYNLYGMSYLVLSKWVPRAEMPETGFPPGSQDAKFKVSYCELECDAVAGSIWNRKKLSEKGKTMNPGLENIWAEEMKRRKKEGKSEREVQVEESQERIIAPTEGELIFRKRLSQYLEDRKDVEDNEEIIEAPVDPNVQNAYLWDDHIDSHSLPENAVDVIGPEDMSLVHAIEELMDREGDLADMDSVLGSQVQENEDEDEEQEVDLTQPLEGLLTEPDENIDDEHGNLNIQSGEANSNENYLWDETFWGGINNISQLSDDVEVRNRSPLYLDGQADDASDSSPSKGAKEKSSKQRYEPLKVTIQKSPNRRVVSSSLDSKDHDVQTAEQLKQLQEVASKINEKICSPKTSPVSLEKSTSGSEKLVQRVGRKTISKRKLNRGRKSLNQSFNKSGSLQQGSGSVSRNVRKALFPGEQNSSSDESQLILINDDINNTFLEVINESQDENSEILGPSPDHSIMSFYNVTCDKTAINLSIGVGEKIFEPLNLPPSFEVVSRDLKSVGQPSFSKPYYGNPMDMASAKEVGCELIKLQSKCIFSLEEYDGSFGAPLKSVRLEMFEAMNDFSGGVQNISKILSTLRPCIITPVAKPPTRMQVKEWLNKSKDVLCTLPEETESAMSPVSDQQHFEFSQNDSVIWSHLNSQTCSLDDSNIGSGSSTTPKVHYDKLETQLEDKSNSCSIDCVTPDNSGAFKMELQNLQDARETSEHKYLTLLAVELHIPTRRDLKPDPQYDPISAIFYSIKNDIPQNFKVPLQIIGMFVVSKEREERNCESGFVVSCFDTELEMINEFVTFIRKWDPDILAGYEIEMLSWGYLIERGYKLGLNLINEFSRIKKIGGFGTQNFNIYELKVTGRIVLNVWRLMRHEAALMSYSFENIMYHVLHSRVPCFSFQTLTRWWNHHLQRKFVFKHYFIRVEGIVQILEQLDIIGRTSELASLFGIQFYEVFSRGSQFRVESIMLRMAKLQNYVAVSPNVQQRAAMRAPECLPLIMEPFSRFYTDPVIVLDFQSLYPSMIIAYNLCFSTCLGRLDELTRNERFEFGCTTLEIPFSDLISNKENIHISPVGIVFVNDKVRKGILPLMLEEILNTRLMVKKSLKEHKSNKILRRVLDARQLGLKLIANVTYGYTSANFSGRMACVEIADSVVSKGRETLQRAIELVAKTPKWGAEVVYGDTDSMFVLCPGKTRKEAFLIGQEIADAVTNSNPQPVKLKLEKVYQPCILQTKKRYVGYMYESSDQKDPVYEAKGIETVRRDGCPAVSKILEKSIRILFESNDMSKVKAYVCRQMEKLLSGRISLQDLTFAREFRGLTGYKTGACVPALKLTREWLLRDERAEPRVGERVGYIIAFGAPGLPLIELVHSPEEFFTNFSLKINAEYYIVKAILPPLDRCFTLLGAKVFAWYNSLPRKQMKHIHNFASIDRKKSTISQYFASTNCLICNVVTQEHICSNCQKLMQLTAANLYEKINISERHFCLIEKLCQSCCGRNFAINCQSLDCPVTYRKRLFHLELQESRNYYHLMEETLHTSF